MESRGRLGGDSGMTSGRRFERPVTREVSDTRDEVTRARDNLIRSYMLNPDLAADLQREDPVTWVRDAVAMDTHRSASQVNDDELARTYVEGGMHEWDPHVSKRVAMYLRGKGYILIP